MKSLFIFLSLTALVFLPSKMNAQPDSCTIFVDTEEPFFEDFDSYTHEQPIPCWTMDNSYVTCGNDGTLFFRNYSAGHAAVMPMVTGNVVKMEITFLAKVGNVGDDPDALVIGLADSTGTSFDWLDTIPGQGRGSFHEYTYRFNKYNGNKVRIAFTNSNYIPNWMNIDSLTLRVLPSCLNIENLKGHNYLDADSTYFTWENPGEAIQFNLVLTTYDTIADSLPTLIDTVLTDSSFVIPVGLLSMGNKYHLFVRSDCESSFSYWTHLPFRSGTVVMPMTGTDTVQGCGIVVYDNGGPLSGYYVNTTSSVIVRAGNVGESVKVVGGSMNVAAGALHSLNIYDGEGTTGAVIYTATTDIPSIPEVLGTGSAITIQFTAGMWADPGIEIITACYIPEGTCPEPTINSANVTDNSATINYSSSAGAFEIGIIAGSTWNETAATIIQTTTTSHTFIGLAELTQYTVAVRAQCDTNTYSNWKYITITTDEIPVCDVPTSLTGTKIDSTSTSINWISDASEWMMQVNGGEEFAVNSNPYTLTDLVPNTPYTVRIKAVCGVNLSSDWSNEYNFIANQNEDIPDVDGIDVNIYPNPAANILTIEFGGSVQVNIIDLNGRELYRAEANEKLNVNVATMGKGTYFVRIVGADGIVVRKLVVK